MLDPEWVFLNNGSFGATPKVVLAEQDRWRQGLERQPLQFMRELPARIRDICDRLGHSFGADGQDIALVTNASSGVHSVLSSLEFSSGDELLTTGHAYGAVRQAMRHFAERSGATVVEAEVPFPIASSEEVVTAVRKAITPRTRLAVLDHITSFSGLVYPIEALVAECRSRGIPVLVDGAHAPGTVPIDLRSLDADFYTGNLHKWLFAPKGCGFLWVKPEHQSKIHPTVISHGYQQGFTEEFDWTGTFDPSAWLSIPAALTFAANLGIEEMRSYNRTLCAEAAALLSETWGVTLPAPPEMRGFSATLPYPGEFPASEAPRLAGALQARRIEVHISPWGGRCWLRVSAQVYNERSDYEILAHAIS